MSKTKGRQSGGVAGGASPGWQKAFEDWKAAGGDQVTKELNELYAKDPNKVVPN